ncbi:MAG TPA: ribonuclease domain-containing protein [Blastocatellia bacterium]|nr:ribonuclease domain-containing protein [Blastocatellia bacterium]
MPIVGTVFWGLGEQDRSPLRHHLLSQLDRHVQECNQVGVASRWHREVFRNTGNDLPRRPHGYYWEFRLTNSSEPGTYRMVLGGGGEVFVTWDHYHNFLQVFRVPGVFPIRRPRVF